MVVYADILIILNLTVDYMLIAVTGKILRLKPPLIRQTAAAAVGGISSLYIFVQNTGVFAGLLVRIGVCTLMSLIAFGFKSIICFLRASAVLLGVCLAYGGIMTALWTLFKPHGMTVVNSVVYFNISPSVLIGVSVTVYLIYMLLSAVLAKTSAAANRCRVTVFAGESSVSMDGIVDTGNSVEDIIGGGDVIIADDRCVKELFGNVDIEDNSELKTRYRVLPCGTVSGNGTLEGFRCDSATVTDGENTVKLKKPILAVSKTRLKDDYRAIVNPNIFL